MLLPGITDSDKHGLLVSADGPYAICDSLETAYVADNGWTTYGDSAWRAPQSENVSGLAIRSNDTLAAREADLAVIFNVSVSGFSGSGRLYIYFFDTGTGTLVGTEIAEVVPETQTIFVRMLSSSMYGKLRIRIDLIGDSPVFSEIILHSIYTYTCPPDVIDCSAGYTLDTAWGSSGLPHAGNFKIASNGVNFVVVAQNGNGVVIYGDTTGWLTASTGSGLYMRGVAAMGAQYCTIAVDSSGYGNYTYDSFDDGATWTAIEALVSTKFWIDLAASPTSFIAIEPDGVVARKTATSRGWSESAPFSSINWSRVNWGNDTYIIVSLNGYIAVSIDDGVSWTSANEAGGSVPFNDACWNGAYWVVAATNGAMYRSSSGLTGTWSQCRAPTGQAIYTINQCDGVFYAPVYNSSTMVYSTDDGDTWGSFVLSASGLWYDMACNTSKLVAMGTNNVVHTTTGVGCISTCGPIVLQTAAAVSWGIASSIEAASNIVWSVAWDSSSEVTKSIQMYWEVAQETNRNAPIKWGLQAQNSIISKNAPILWSNGQTINKAQNVLWGVGQQIQKGIPINWQIL